MPDVFISYTRGDRGRVKLLAQALEAEGFSVWWDTAIRPGKGWHDTIRKELAETPAVIVCWSKASVKSDWVLAEATQAYNQHKLAPALIQRCEPPIPYNMVQSADLAKWKGQGDDPDWTALLLEVRRLVEKSKGKIFGAVPPPGEAHGAEMVGRTQQPVQQPQPAMQQPLRAPPPPPEPEPAWEEAEYEPATTRGKLGPRLGRLAAGAVGVTALITGGLWAGPEIVKMANGMGLEMLAPPPDAAYAPPPPIKLAAMPAVNVTLAEYKTTNATVKFAKFRDLPVDAPETTAPLPPAVKPPETKPPESKPPETRPPETRPPTIEPTRTVGTITPDVTVDLDRCLTQLLKSCGKVDSSYAADFVVDGKFSPGERRLLSQPLFPDGVKASAQNLGVCRAAVASGARTATRACSAMAPAALPTVTTGTRPPITTLDTRPVLTIPEKKPATTETISTTGRTAIKVQPKEPDPPR